jgi:hypothetical protein
MNPPHRKETALSMVLRSVRKSIQWIDFSEEGHGSGSEVNGTRFHRVA